MCTRLHSSHGPLVTVLFGLLTLAACDAVSRPEAPTGPLAAGSFSAATSGDGGSSVVPSTDDAALQSVERPYGAQLVWTTYAFVTAAQSGDPRFGGRCSVPSRYVEFGNLRGEITHAGRSQGTGSHCVQGTPQTGITFTDGTLSFVTANGDVLAGTYGGGTLSAVDGRLVLESSFTLTGGTGRFEGASGAGTQRGETTATPPQVLAGAPIYFEQTGTITYAPGRGGQ
jgi:hypothetical protein